MSRGKATGSCCRGSDEREIFRAGLATHLVGLELEGHFLPFGEAGQASPFHRADVNEHVLSTILRLNEAKTLLAVKPLHNTCRHVTLSSRRNSALRPHDLRAGSNSIST